MERAARELKLTYGEESLLIRVHQSSFQSLTIIFVRKSRPGTTAIMTSELEEKARQRQLIELAATEMVATEQASTELSASLAIAIGFAPPQTSQFGLHAIRLTVWWKNMYLIHKSLLQDMLCQTAIAFAAEFDLGTRHGVEQFHLEVVKPVDHHSAPF